MSPSTAQLFARKWADFTHLGQTQDTLAQDRRGMRRWLLMPYIAFVIPIDDPAVIAQLKAWQQALLPWMKYDPQPVERMHITLHYAGMLRHNVWTVLPYTWRPQGLADLAQRVEPVLQDFPSFTIQIGPLNAFSNALFAEVRDERTCLRMLRIKVRQALPLRARPPATWAYLPHITLGYWGRQPAAPVIDALAPFRQVEPVPYVVRNVKLTTYERDHVALGSDLLSAARETVIATFTLRPGPAE